VWESPGGRALQMAGFFEQESAEETEFFVFGSPPSNNAFPGTLTSP